MNWRKYLPLYVDPAEKIRGKVVLITGASSGIGQATARQFASYGAHLVITGRNESALQQLQVELSDVAGEILIVTGDLTCDDDIQRIVTTAIQHFDRIDVLINNAGILFGGAITEYTGQQVRQLIDINLYAMIHLTQLVVPQMLKQDRGHIINVSSVAGAVLGGGQSAYAASKAGANGFTHALRRELAGSGIRVSLFMPGWTDTPLLQDITEKDMVRARLVNRFSPLRSSDFMARTIVDIYCHNHMIVMKGGLGFWFASVLHRLSPQLVDGLYRIYFNKSVMTDVFKRMSRPDE